MAVAMAATAPKKQKRAAEGAPKGAVKKPKREGDAPPRKAAGSKRAAGKPGAAAKRAKAAAASAVPLAAPAASAAPASKVGELDGKQIERAVTALRTHLEREAAMSGTALLDEPSPLHVVVSTKRMPDAPKPGSAKAHKPILIALPHAWRTLAETSVCIVVKDPQRDVKKRAAEQGIDMKIIGVEKLKKKFVPFEARRELRKAHELMLADDRVLPLLPRLLGSDFFKRNKLPLPVVVTKKDLRAEIERAVGGAVLRPTKGTCFSFPCASTALSTAHAAENIVAAVAAAVGRTPGRWTNVQAVHLRATNSVSLPIYSAI